MSLQHARLARRIMSTR